MIPFRLGMMFIAAVLLGTAGCKSISDISTSLLSLEKMEFRLAGIQDMRLAGVGMSSVAAVSDLSIQDALALTTAFQRRSLPTTFVLKVEARNPNTGGAGKRSSPLKLTALNWRLIIDGVPTVAGDLDRPIEIPGTQDVAIIPITVSIDLYRFFAEQGYDKILNLAMALGGKQGSTARVQLDAKPSVEAPFGSLTYPGRITIVDSEFRQR
ncbi:MAG: hypothetical protein ACO3I4_05660 [Candidatus Kapaibacteriota bacterium]